MLFTDSPPAPPSERRQTREEGDEIQSGSFKALSVLLEFIDQTSEEDFCILYLADMFKNEIKTKFNSFLQNGFKYKQNS